MVVCPHVPHIIERRNPDPESGIPKKEKQKQKQRMLNFYKF
jgi:hypothetical protein